MASQPPLHPPTPAFGFHSFQGHERAAAYSVLLPPSPLKPTGGPGQSLSCLLSMGSGVTTSLPLCM